MFTGEITRSRSRGPLYIIVAILVVIGGAVLLVPVPRTIKTTFKLLPARSIELSVPRSGTIGEVVASEGVILDKGAVVAKYDPAEAEKKVKDTETLLAETQKKLTPAGLRASAQGLAMVAKAAAAERAAQAALEKAKTAAKGRVTPAVTAAQTKVEAAASSVAKAKEAAGPTKEDLEKEVARLMKALDDAKSEQQSPNVLAPEAGLVSNFQLSKGQGVQAGAVVARLDEVVKLKAVVAVPAGEKVAPGMMADLQVGPTKRRVKLETVSATAEGVVENPKKELKVGTEGPAEIIGESRSLSGVF